MKTAPTLLARCAAGLLSAGMTFGVVAQTASAESPEARYQRERAACRDGSSHQDRATCLKEAVNALDEARRNPDPGRNAQDWISNRLARCDRVPAQDREACQRMALGQGERSGSVEAGAVVKEITEIKIGPPVVIQPIPR